MRDKMPLLRRQLLAWLLIPLSLLLAMDAVVSYGIALKFSQRAYDRALLEIARDLSLHLTRKSGTLSLDIPAAARNLLFSDPVDRIEFEITTADGRHVEGAQITPAPAVSRAAPSNSFLYDGEHNGMPVRIVQLAATDGSLVRVAETKNKRTELAQEILASVVLPQVLLILIAGVLVWVGVVRGLSPLERLRQAVVARSPRDCSPVTMADVPGEVRPLLQSINDLMLSLDGALTMQSRFISDAAHQLKTPMAVLKTQLELALREQDPAQIHVSLKKVLTGLERLSRVTNQMLSLARNEPEAARKIDLVELDLHALALEVSTSWVPEALKKRIDMGFDTSDGPVMIRGDIVRLRELCDNLIDNAIRYSPDGGRVTVRVSAAPAPSLSVSDDSPSIPIDERERVFERFHRLLGTSTDGSGLGLAIVKEIAHLHGAEVVLLDDADGTGHTFTVKFPCLPPDKPSM